MIVTTLPVLTEKEMSFSTGESPKAFCSPRISRIEDPADGSFLFISGIGVSSLSHL